METGLFGALIGAGANIGLGLYNNHYNAKQSRASDARQYSYWRKMQRYSLLNGPSLTRQGLEAAGYNPMLALGHLGGSVASPTSHSSTSGLSFDGSSASSLGRLFNELALKSEKAKVDNIKADTDLKEAQMDAVETQRLQDEAQTSLIHSQTERSDLAYGRDIVGTVADVAGTAGSLYSAKAMRDIARAPTETITTIHHGDKTKPSEIIQNRGKPAVQSTPKATTPNVGGLGHSAKSVGKVAGDLANMLVLPAMLGTAAAKGVYPMVDQFKNQSRKDIERNNRKSPIQFPTKKEKIFVPRFGM